MKTIFSILFLSLFIACTSQNENITRIGLDKLSEMSTDENTIIIDVRTPSEVAEGYVKSTSKFIDYKGTSFDQSIDVLDKDKTYIVYCRSGNRSTKALNSMAEKGFKNLFELEGGASAVPANQLIK